MARKKKHKHEEHENGEAWLLPYSDLMTLLLAVFIVLFAVSNLDKPKAAEAAAAFQKNMLKQGAGVLPKDGSSVIPLNPNGNDGSESESTEDGTDAGAQDTQTEAQQNAQETAEQTEKNNLEGVQSQLNGLFQEEGVADSVSTYIDQRGLIISLNNAILFDSGSAQIKIDNEDTLLKIANIINTLDNYIRIEGHTDNRPISTYTYPSNWELSAARASSVVRLFIEKCNITPEKMVAVGYGEFRPIGDNASEEGRAKNRRIDIIILSEKFNSLENQSAE